MDMWDAVLASVGAAATWMSRSIIRHDQDIAILSSKLAEYQKTNAERLDSMEENNAARHHEVREDLKALSAVVVDLHRDRPRLPSLERGPRTAPPTGTPDER
jgi:hypothetical protein